MDSMTQQDIITEGMRNVYPSFRYSLEVDDSFAGLFLECTLPTLEWEVEEVKEGGLNTNVHQLPGLQKSSSRLILKTGVLVGSLKYLSKWYLDSMKSTFSRKKVTVKLLSMDSTELVTWEIQDAFPVKLTAPVLKADSNAIAINTLELACGLITMNTMK
jgi:phage tail-like protein